VLKPGPPLPPGIARRLLDLAARGEDGFAVRGDFDEEFAELCEGRGSAKARFWYWRQALRSIPRLLGDYAYWRIVMFRNYLKIALRSIRKKKGYAFINIAGWAVGMAVCTLIMLWVQDELSFDRFHRNADRIYRLTIESHFGAPQSAPVAPTPAGPALARDFPEILKAARLERPRRSTIIYGDKEYIEEGIGATDNSFFEIFSFPFLAGEPKTALALPYTAVITESTARKIFKSESPLGRFVKLEDGKDYAITGVLKDAPGNSHIAFNLLRSFETLVSENRAATENWFSISTFAYLLLDDKADPRALEAKFPPLIDKNMGQALRAAGGTMTLRLQPLTRIHLHSDFAVDVAPQGDISTVLLFSGIGLLVLLIASINFINLSTARSATRAKEVGLRKTLGAIRGRLVGQFLGESVLYSFLAMILGFALHFPGLLLFGRIIGRTMHKNVFQVPWMPPAILGLSLFVGLAAGLYPAFILSSFQPVRVLKGQLRAGGGVWFRRVLVVTQFAISVLLIISTLVISRQINYAKNKKLGFDKEHVLVVPRMSAAIRTSFASVRSELESIPGVLKVGASSMVPGRGIARSVFFPEGFSRDQPQPMDLLFIEPGFIPALDIQLAAGRNFSEERESDKTEAVLINETAARRFGWADPIGKRFVLNSGPGQPGEAIYLTVIGMIRDYHTISLRQKIEPQLIRYNPGAVNTISIRLAPGDLSRTLDLLKRTWKKLDPQGSLDYAFLDDLFDNQYRADERMKAVTLDFGALAILIGCLGLFGMSSFTVERRTKEIGIRKILGSSAAGIVRLLSKETVFLIVFANAMAWPAAYYLMNLWLRQFAYRTSMPIWVFAAAAILSVLIAFLTVSYQSVRAALGKPADALRYE
jgi:putative ABC transport system permease protein